MQHPLPPVVFIWPVHAAGVRPGLDGGERRGRGRLEGEEAGEGLVFFGGGDGDGG